MSFDAGRCPVTYGHLAHDWRSLDGWRRCPGVPIPVASRAQQPSTRRHVLAELRSLKNLLQLKIGRWAVTGVEYDGGRFVPRRVEDFPENNVDAWLALAHTCEDVIDGLRHLQNYATARAREVERYDKARERP